MIGPVGSHDEPLPPLRLYPSVSSVQEYHSGSLSSFKIKYLCTNIHTQQHKNVPLQTHIPSPCKNAWYNSLNVQKILINKRNNINLQWFVIYIFVAFFGWRYCHSDAFTKRCNILGNRPMSGISS